MSQSIVHYTIVLLSRVDSISFTKTFDDRLAKPQKPSESTHLKWKWFMYIWTGNSLSISYVSSRKIKYKQMFIMCAGAGTICTLYNVREPL